MKKIILKMILLLLIAQGAWGQFVKFSHASVGTGFVRSQGALITSIAMAGGGVVLKTVARPKYPGLMPAFTGVNFKEMSGISTMYIKTPETTIFYSDSSWITRDAAMLVNSESRYKMYREINLLGELKSGEKLPSNLRRYFIVEVANALQDTKSGQTLLYMDIMLTEANTLYYSTNHEAAQEYEASSKYLTEIIQSTNLRKPSIKLKYEKLVLKGKHLVAMEKTKKISETAFKRRADTILYEMDELISKGRWNDYTYNDENADYTFYTKNDERLNIDGTPNYTFLSHDYIYDSTVVDTVNTSYYLRYPQLIKNLNYIVVTNAEHFGKIAAFYRYLKINYPTLWNQVYAHYLHTEKTLGETPRFISATPPDGK